MNILFLSRLFYPHIGGVEKHVLEISRILIKKGHKVTVVAEQDSAGEKLRETIDGINVYRIPGLKEGSQKKIKIWNWILANISLIRQADVVHCHDVFFWYLPFRFIFPFKKVFTTFHGYEGYPLRFKNVLMHKISEVFSCGNICIGSFIEKWYKTKADYILYGGVSPATVKNFKSEARKEIAVFIGRLDGQTGITTYVKAAELIKEKFPKFNLLVIGNGHLKNKVNGKVKILESRKNASDYFQKYEFAFVSRYLSILEAMAAKCLVFAVYDNPLKEDYLRMAPFSKFINIVSSPSELAKQVSRYMGNKKAKEEIAERAYDWVKDLTWANAVKTYSALWNK